MDKELQTTSALELPTEELIALAVENNEGIIANNGAFSTTTGARTGRSPNDRFIVKEPSTDDLIEWGDVNKPFNEEKFDALWNKVDSYLAEKNRYVSHVHVGSHAEHYLPVKVITENDSTSSSIVFKTLDTFNP